MPKVADLSREIENYRQSLISLGEYEDRFRDAAATMFAESEEVIEACFEIEAALSKYHFEGITEDELREELAAAIAPFPKADSLVFWIDDVLLYQGSNASTTGWNEIEEIPGWLGVVVTGTAAKVEDVDRQSRPLEDTVATINWALPSPA